MFAQLYHEAFHAYVENYVCPQAGSTLPHWLNEGLAQIFEAGQIEADSLRIDAPDRTRLVQLQDDLRAERPLTIEEVVAADEQDFLNPSSSRSAQRYYLYSWGLAYYLTFEKNRLRPEILDSFLCNPETTARRPVSRDWSTCRSRNSNGCGGMPSWPCERCEACRCRNSGKTPCPTIG